MKKNNLVLFKYGCLFFSLFNGNIYAQDIPPMGSIIQPIHPAADYRNLVRESLTQNPPVVETPSSVIQPVGVEDLGFVELKKIDLKHNLTHVNQVELENITHPYLNKKIKLSELKKMTAEIQQWLFQKYGLVKVKVWVPLQEIKNQTLQIEIHQGSVADILVVQTLRDSRQEDQLIKLAGQFLKKNDPLTQSALEEVAYRAIDYLKQPVKIILMPTKQIGEYQVILDTQSTPRVSGGVTVDNTGSRFTDTWRDHSHVSIANLWGTAGDLQLSGQVWNEFQHSWYARYEQPTISGWRYGIDAQYADYELCCDFSAMNSSGLSWSVNTDLTKTLIRSRKLSSWLTVGASYWSGQNKFFSQEISDRKIYAFDLSGKVVWSNQADHYLSAAVKVGHADLGAVLADQQQDQQSAQVDGNFYKFNAYYGLIYPVNQHSSVYWTNQGQLANKNLDSSQKMSVGGLAGVRAYPYGEGLSDQAFTSQLEYRYQINRYLQAKAFYDFGYAHRHTNPWQNLNNNNSYHLHGLGAGLVWHPIPQASFTLLTAGKLGENAGADELGRDHDAKSSDIRTWFIANWSF